MDIRPWGSMSTIVTFLYITYKRKLPAPIAKIMMMAILSDTLNLRSITTTEADRCTVALLREYCGVVDTDDLCSRQFQAKTDWIVNLGEKLLRPLFAAVSSEDGLDCEFG
jgi:manganese-dependent inorganic pyrophosphatase